MADIGPRHAGTLCGVSNTVATLPGVLANLSAGFILEHTERWSIVFGLATAMYAFGAVSFARYCEGRVVFE